MATAELPEHAERAGNARWRWLAQWRGLAQWGGRAVDQLRVWSAAEAGRAVLWIPVAIGAGAASYLCLRSEPVAWIAPLLAALCVILVFASARFRLLALAGAFYFFGFALADLRTSQVSAPILAREISPAAITGTLISVEESAGQRRLIIDVDTIERVEAIATPARVRVTWKGKDFDVLPGDRITLRAGLSPPPPPLAPGAFDFSRQLFFQRIGAVGFAVTPPQKLANAPTAAETFRATIETIRLSIARRILEQAPNQGGAVVAAVVTGKREAIDDRSAIIFEDSGIAHLLAISGLHMGLATGLIFFTVRMLLAMVEPVARRYPIKKWAAAAALLSGFVYLLLSGGGFSARRAFVMTAVVFAAILVDRRALSLRNLAVAATIILLTTPEAVLHPGFQMSFAAVTALVAAYEWASSRASPDRSFEWPARLRRYVVGIAATDTISAVATAPFNLFHFARAANFGLAANLIAIPVMGFWIMPAAIMALVLMPLGADGDLWRIAAAGVDLILWIGDRVASLPGAVTTLGRWPPEALVVVTFGGLWLCLQTARWRLAGLAALPIAVLMVAQVSRPAAFFSPRGDNVGVIVQSADGPAIAMLNKRKDKFAAGAWMEYAGLNAQKASTVAIKDLGDDMSRCDPAGCVVLINAVPVAISSDPLALADDCARASLLIATYPVNSWMKKACAAPMIDRRDAWNEGAHAIWIDGKGAVRIRSVGQARGVRPWTPPAQNAKQDAVNISASG